MQAKAKMVPKKQQMDEDSTDAGSSASDCESTCSSTVCGHHSDGQSSATVVQAPLAESKGRQPLPPGLPVEAKRNIRLQGAPPLSHCDGTPLEPIPSSPVSRKETLDFHTTASDDYPHSPRDCQSMLPPSESQWTNFCEDAPMIGQMLHKRRSRLGAVGEVAGHVAAPSPAPTASPGTKSTPVLAYVPQTPPVSPTRRQRVAMLARAKEYAVPLKVRLAGSVPTLTGIVNRSEPVKKRPPFPDLLSAGVASRLKCIDPREPVSKRASDFLLADPPRVVPVRPAR